MAQDGRCFDDSASTIQAFRVNAVLRNRLTRRAFLISSTAAARAADNAAARYRTPYKIGKLVLAASHDVNAFDSRAVDCPFLFHHGGRYYMTYIGWDGTGYQTG